MNPGLLNRQVIIQKRTVTQNSYGEETKTYSTLATVWANIQIGSGREFFGAQKVNSELSGIIKIRYKEGLTSDMRVVYNGTTYDLVSPPIDIDDRRRFIRLEVKEVVDNGQQ